MTVLRWTRPLIWAGGVAAVTVAAVAVTPAPCAACSPPPPGRERLVLELTTVTEDGVAADPSGWSGYEVALEADFDGAAVLVVGRAGEQTRGRLR